MPATSDETQRLLPKGDDELRRSTQRVVPRSLTLSMLVVAIAFFGLCFTGIHWQALGATALQGQLAAQTASLNDYSHVSFPLDCSFHQYTLSADDDGLAYVSGDGRAFRSDHTNLFGRGVTGKIVSVDANAFLIRSNGECCRFMDSGDEILLKPSNFFNFRSVGRAAFDTALATLWVDPAQASMFWLDEGGLPLRWDYIPQSPTGKRISAGKMMSMVFANFTFAPQDKTLFDVPASCTTAQRCRFD
ncbi:Aste57867_20633 [Aphanomyces stellatus]|uniref:Aste57867_20633 protein n=1 Tax=Aphanomyces stellatus TaxID=120398 RepID=A0A485LFI6_9STRA|nr:hypothetical protein As57867_020565 [Aphanomyces stellatus]VFT97313.1 Aste57867_20633 [Aphanomyces stellatus]